MRSTIICALFDTGSQRTSISNNLKACLDLKPLEKENLRLNTFRDDHVRKETSDVVKLRLSKGDGEKFDVPSLSFLVICSSSNNKIVLKNDVNILE